MVSPLSEIWGLLFGGAGNSKGPLLLFVCSVLLWCYPMYVVNFAIIANIATIRISFPFIHHLMIETRIFVFDKFRYMIRVIPKTWNLVRKSHYCYIYWNILMWISWIIANRRDPGYIPLNSDQYYRAIRQIPYYEKWKKRNLSLNRLCHSCRCLRPLRAKHCRVCNRLVFRILRFFF